MKIKKLLEVHKKQSHPKGLSRNLGDGYLLNNNRIFRSIRNLALAEGFRYSDSLNANYQSLPLVQLESILSTRTIPYLDNVSSLEMITDQLKEKLNFSEVSHGLRRNYLFHESCHAVIRQEIIKNNRIQYDLGALHGQRQKTIQILLEESFANTCELLSVIDVNDEVHKVFYEMNSYSFLFEERTHFKNLMQDLDEKKIFKFFTLVYLLSNFLKNEITKTQFQILTDVIFGKQFRAPKYFFHLSQIPFTLDLQFRIVTTGLHLKLSGIDRSPKEVLDFDFIDVFLKDEILISNLNAAIEKTFQFD